MPDLVGTVVGGRYRLERELGRGGMATVWLARDSTHERPVAIKIIHPHLAGAIGVDRFIREVRLTGQLQHPHIVPLLDSGSLPGPDGQTLAWYAMQFLEGESLRDRLSREGQLPVEETLRIAEAVGNALAAAHRHGIVHRDIKPENILLSGGHVYVVDFGIAKALAETEVERLTSTGLAIGTPAYMSPEQAMADRVDARTDQYSLAAIVYEMLAGEPPFSGPTAQAIVARRFAEAVRPMRPVRPTVPETVERAVLRALERSPADRFPDVARFAAALRGEGEPGRPPASRGRGARRALVAGVVLAVVAGGGWLLSVRARPLPGPARDSVAVALYQRGLAGQARRTAAGVAEAIAVFGRAVERDSTYADAWTGLANSYVQARNRFFEVPGLPHDSLLQRAVEAANRALAADSGSSAAWLAQAAVALALDPTDVGPPMRSVRRAIALDSTNAPARFTLASYQANSGDLAAATDTWRDAVRMAPDYGQGVAFLGLAHFWRRQFDSAAVWADSAIALDPTYLLGRTTAGQVAVERGDFGRAAAAFEAARRLVTGVEVANATAGSALVAARAGRGAEAVELLRTADSLAAPYVPIPPHTAVFLAHAWAAAGQPDRALAWLERYQPRRDLHFQLHLRCDPPFDPLRRDDRFRALLVMPSPPPGQGC